MMQHDLFDPPKLPTLLAVVPVIDYSVRGLCAKPYPLHPKGCPNFNKCDRCPPRAPLFDKIFDTINHKVYAVINEFDLGSHAAKMALKHPAWTDRQRFCVLYWQGTARKQLNAKIASAIALLPGYEATWCPEGMGVNVTATLEAVGIDLEWPPVRVARQVSLFAVPSLKIVKPER